MTRPHTCDLIVYVTLRPQNSSPRPRISHVIPVTQWLECQFINYLYEWEAQAQQSGFSMAEQNKMLLSHPTREGLRIR